MQAPKTLQMKYWCLITQIHSDAGSQFHKIGRLGSVEEGLPGAQMCLLVLLRYIKMLAYHAHPQNLLGINWDHLRIFFDHLRIL